ncbi:MAG: DUF2911 domain-containing protein [Gemmatimonadota bacterium]
MNRMALATTLAFTVLLPAGLHAQQQAPAIPQAAASTRASTEVLLNGRIIVGRWFPTSPALAGPGRIAIDYGQPHARGRTIAGGVVPYGEVWRAGANLATHLTTDVELELGGSLVLPRGTYTLFLNAREEGWELIVNRQTGQWGTDRDPAHDVGRIPLSLRTPHEPMESFTIWLIPNSPATEGQAPSGVLKMAWGEVELTTEWRVVWP